MQIALVVILSFLVSSYALVLPRAFGTLGGTAPPVIKTSEKDRPFEVDGDTFTDRASALQRSCDIQKNKCSDEANAGKASFSTNDCETQHSKCPCTSLSQKKLILTMNSFLPRK